MMKLVVFCCAIAVATATAPVYFTPAIVPSIGYGVQLQQPFYNYRGPLSLAPGQPANILAADGRPLDTLSVNLDRAAHFVAKALDTAPRVLKKRSVTRLAVAPGPVGFSAAAAAGNIGISPIAAGPTGVAVNIATNPIGLSVPYAAGPFSATGPLAAGRIGLTGPLAGPYGVPTPVAAGRFAVPTTIAAGPIAVSAPVANFPVGI